MNKCIENLLLTEIVWIRYKINVLISTAHINESFRNMNRIYGGAIYWQILKLKRNNHFNRIQHVTRDVLTKKIKHFHI